MTSVLAANNVLRPIPAGQSPSSVLPSVDAGSHGSQAMHAHDEADSQSNIPRGPVEASLNFYKDPEDGAAPYNYVEVPKDGSPQRNFGAADHTVTIHDARGSESSFNLEKDAFATLKGYPHNSAIDWTSDASVEKHYYPEVEKILLENIPGSNRILIFDHTIRRQNPDAPRAPVTRAHIDQTPKSAKQRVEFHLPDEAEKLLQGRYMIVNVWRPINGKVEASPLAFAASASVPDNDMVSVEHRYPNRTGETAGVRYNPDHEWYYWSGIDNDERILLQCFDSARPNNRVPHTAFVDPRETPQSKGRESIEVRALVFG